MFTYSANVKCVNGMDTWIEFMFTDYSGILSEDIEAISIVGPNGLITNDLNDFHIYDNSDYLLYRVADLVPELGEYTLSVTIGGIIVDHTDTQSINRSLPTVDNQTMIPAPGDTVPTNTTFKWGAVADPGYTIYYGIQIRDDIGNYIANERWIENFEYDVPLISGDYTWQIIVMDGPDWVAINNRTNGNWETFKIS